MALPTWLTLLVFAAQTMDLAKLYPATLAGASQQRGYEWTTAADDVWSLESFRINLGETLTLELGPSTVVFGHHDKNVLWAAVFPATPGDLRSKALPSAEQATSVWLRFNPARVAELFPSETIIGRGSAMQVIAAKRLAAWKLRGSWHSGDLAMAPTGSALIVDADTTAGMRRFFNVDATGMAPAYINAFERQALPAIQPVDEKTALDAFDQVWEAFDREYAMFSIRKNVDWAALRDKLRPRAATARSTYEVAAVIADLLAPLEDLHVSVQLGAEYVPVFNRPRPLNASMRAIAATVGKLNEGRRELPWGRTADGIGYIAISRLTAKNLPETFDRALDDLSDTWALILDLRFNGGGDEPMAQRMAGRFVDQPRLYSTHQYRNGPAHDQLGPTRERRVEPRGPWRYESAVIVLIGQRTMSSAESFALMLAQCPQVTTMGDRTAGASGNPRSLDLPGGIKATLPRWLDRLPDGTPLEPDGIQPAVRVEAEPESFTDRNDPVLDAALARLREQPTGERKPGKRP